MMFSSPIHNPRSAIRAKRHGFALPMTIIAIAGLTLLLIGLLTVLTLERKTARSYSDSARADLAVESGLAVALASLSEIAGRDDSLVFRIEDPLEPQVTADDRPLGFREQFFTYGAVFENGAWRGIPLFSGEPGTALAATRIDTTPLITALSTYVADDNTAPIGTPSEHDQNIPRAKWVDVPSSDPDGYTFRYSYWIEDLSGRIDGRYAGALPRARGESAEEIQLFSFFGEEDDGVEDTLVAKRENLRTPASAHTLPTEVEAARIEPYIYYGLPPITSSTIRPPDLVPHGFGYADAGNQKTDLNPLVEAADVEGIAEHITTNLPDFINRRGGFLAGQDYVKTIAANIIDYADVDTNATSGSDYRGVDSYPFVNQLYDRYERLASPSNQVRIKVDTYAEFWNPTNQSMSGFIRFKNVNRMKIRIPFVGDPVFGDVTYNIPAFSMGANEYKVVLVGSRTYTFGPLPSDEVKPTFPETTENNNFELYWRDSTVAGGGLILVDTARGIVERQASGLGDAGQIRWKGNGSVVFDVDRGQYGDPRLTFYTTGKNFANTYATNSSWGGRTKKGTSVRPSAREVRASDWPDGGSDAPLGRTPGSDAVTPNPTGLSNGNAYSDTVATMNPSIISNSGRYDSIFELGNIFDPVQWDELNSTIAGSSPDATGTAGGGTTLAIGRPEYRAMDQEGRRAAQLLDLFMVEPPSLTTPNADLSRININTAPREVLRALIAGVVLEDDPHNQAIIPPSDKQIGDIFADMVIAHRNRMPLRSVSDLGNLRRNPHTARNYSDPLDGPFFGNSNQYIDAAPTGTWKDAGREELFGKVAGRVKYESKTFRIVVAGEVRSSTTNEIIGRSTREFHYTMEPERDPSTGKANPNQPVRLLKHYEKFIQ